MKANDAFLQAVAVSKRFTKESLLGGGALVGKNVTISKIKPIPGGNQVTFSYALDDGQARTSTLDVMDGKDGTPGTNGIDGEDGADGQDGNGILDISKIKTEGLVDTYRISFTDGTYYDYEVENGQQGIQGIPGQQGKDGVEGKQGVQGIQGERGRDGYPFLIYKEYSNVSDFSTSDFPEIGLMFMINDGVSSLFPVYRYTGDEEEPYSYVTSLSGSEPIKGDKGDTGAQGEQGIPGQDGKDGITYVPKIGEVNTLPPEESASASVDVNTGDSSATFNFSIPRGKEGEQGIPGQNGEAPHIGDNDHWFVGDNDTGVPATGPPGEKGKDGKSISGIRIDEESNMIVSFSDGTESNIGKLNIPAEITVDSALDPTSENPVQNRAIAARISEVVSDISTAGDEQKLYTDTKIGELVNGAPETLDTIKEVADAIQENETVVDALNAAIGNKVDKVAGKGLSENDFTTEQMNKLAEIQAGAEANVQPDWNVTDTDSDAFIKNKPGIPPPVTVDTEMSETSTNPVQNKAITAYINKLHGNALHGFEINQAESDPGGMITYIEDSVGRSPAYMDYANDRFDYGGWGSEWFIRNLKPCMLNYDGTVAYELDKNDYTKKKDGTASDVANENFAGNAMVGMPKVYWKISKKSDDVAQVYLCDKNMDGTFKCWSHIDNNGNEIPYCYIPAYEGMPISGVLRSLSGKSAEFFTGASVLDVTELAKKNNKDINAIWNAEVFCDRMLITLLSLLIGKSTDSQSVFGKGKVNFSSSIPTGTMDKKGLFWGEQNGASGVKIFGAEHPWGNRGRLFLGYLLGSGLNQRVKLTYGRSDGTTSDGYTSLSQNYIEIPGTAISGARGGFISKMVFDERGIFQSSRQGSESTYYTDDSWPSTTAVNNPVFFGAHASSGNRGGIFETTSIYALSQKVDASPSGCCASLSCKPLSN